MSQDYVKAKKTNLSRVIYIGICFTTLFTAYISAQNLVSELYTQIGHEILGHICLFTYFAFFALSSPIAAHYKQKFSTKSGLIFGACAHVNFVFAGLFTTYCGKNNDLSGLCSSSFIFTFNVVSAALLGLGAAFIWLFQAIYVDECADEQTKGTLNGLFWSIYQVAQITSSSLATFILGNTDQLTFYLILLVFGVLAIFMLSLVKPPLKINDTLKQEEPIGTLSDTLRSFTNLLKETKYHSFFTGIFFSGMAIGCYISFIGSAVSTTVDSTDDKIIDSSVGYVLIVLSCGEVMAGISVGRVADIYNKLSLLKGTMLLNEMALLITLLACSLKNYTLSIISGFFWGYGDTAIQTMINVLIGSKFGGKPILFSAYRFFQGLGMMYSALITVFISKEMPILYLGIIAVSFGVFHMLYLGLLSKSEPNKNEDYLLHKDNCETENVK